MTEDLEVNPDRLDIVSSTGIFVRARCRAAWGNHDVVHLTCRSLKTWLRSRGGTNTWAEKTVAMLLGHEQRDIETTWPLPDAPEEADHAP